MSIQSAQSFIERIKTDEEFAKNVIACKGPDQRMAYVKESGFEFTINDLNTVLGMLSEEEREQLLSFEGQPFYLWRCYGWRGPGYLQ